MGLGAVEQCRRHSSVTSVSLLSHLACTDRKQLKKWNSTVEKWNSTVEKWNSTVEKWNSTVEKWNSTVEKWNSTVEKCSR